MGGRPSGKRPRKGVGATSQGAVTFRTTDETRTSVTVPTLGAILIAGGSVATVMLILDLTWLGIVALDMYKSQLGNLMRPQPDVLAAGLFYAMYVVATTAYGAMGAKSVGDAVNRGAHWGLSPTEPMN